MRLMLTLTAALAAAPASAAEFVIYDTFGAGNTYDPFIGWAVTGPNSVVGVYSAVGVEFTASSSGSLSSIDFAISRFSGTNSISLHLYTVANGTTGTLLESWVAGPLPANGVLAPPTTVTSVLMPQLNADTQYILFATPGAADTWAGWCQNSIGATGLLYSANASPGTGGTVTDNMLLPALRISLFAPVPEPSSFFLSSVAFGVIGLVARGRRPSAD
jgi:hypothetical protein